jgi:hypothetical protein
MKCIFGDKAVFAIEIRVNRPGIKPFGNIRIWLNSLYCGFYDDEVPILVTLTRLKRIPELLLLDAGLLALPHEIFFNKACSGDIENSDKYFLSLGESFDDFSTIGYFDGGSVVVMWQIDEKTFFSYPEYPEGINSATIPLKMFNEVVDEFESFLREKFGVAQCQRAPG